MRSFCFVFLHHDLHPLHTPDHPTLQQPAPHTHIASSPLVLRQEMDRSAEFFSTAESLRSRAQPHIASDKRRLLSPIEQQQSSGLAPGLNAGAVRPKSEFALMASLINKDILATAGKLQKLARCKVLGKTPTCNPLRPLSLFVIYMKSNSHVSPFSFRWFGLICWRFYKPNHAEQWPSARPCSMTSRSRLVYALPPSFLPPVCHGPPCANSHALQRVANGITMYLFPSTSIGTHLHHQAGHCQTEQANRSTAIVSQGTGFKVWSQCWKTGSGTQCQRCSHVTVQVGDTNIGFQGCARAQD